MAIQILLYYKDLDLFFFNFFHFISITHSSKISGLARANVTGITQKKSEHRSLTFDTIEASSLANAGALAFLFSEIQQGRIPTIDLLQKSEDMPLES
jgi:hypothetical protein